MAFNTVQNNRFRSMDDVHLWMIDNHLGRRSVSDFQRGVLALRKKEILAVRKAQAAQAAQAEMPQAKGRQIAQAQAANASSRVEPPLTRAVLARVARVSSATLGQIERIWDTAAPELVNAIKEGAISINAAAEIATLPSEK